MDDALKVLLIGGSASFIMCIAAMLIRRWPR
jgi:hypothetical protein